MNPFKLLGAYFYNWDKLPLHVQLFALARLPFMLLFAICLIPVFAVFWLLELMRDQGPA